MLVAECSIKTLPAIICDLIKFACEKKIAKDYGNTVDWLGMINF